MVELFFKEFKILLVNTITVYRERTETSRWINQRNLGIGTVRYTDMKAATWMINLKRKMRSERRTGVVDTQS